MYIVTGGVGLIGSAVIWELNRRNIADILVVDHLGCSEKWKNLRALKFADYLEKDEFRTRLAAGDFNKDKIDGVIHMGACSSTQERDASYLIDNNFKATKELAQFCLAKDIRFLYASSCATYGDGSCGYNDDESQIEELRPLNMYGYSKQLFDLWAKRRGALAKITGCKFSNVYGANERHKGDMRSVVLRAFEQITATGKLKLFRSYREEYRDGEQMRDFLYVKDAVDMVLFLFNHPQGAGLYNIGSGRAETWNALGKAAFEALKQPQNIEYIDMPENLRNCYQYYTKAEMGKLKKLGYNREATSLRDSVIDYIRNYLIIDRYLGDECEK
ncbi:MAG: ADP-glyceromanno-heptose 6-epimerase [Victivallales bacterium]|jgi:ADP-L-glycero-D-manno-heptose 6-epimerase|nr:ADP-glyceromanno-heptose 6-epimerase [Victivallales bacterium]